MTNKYYTKYVFEKLCPVFEQLHLVENGDCSDYCIDIIGVTKSGKRYAIKCEYSIDTKLDKRILNKLDEARLRYKCTGALLITNIKLDEKFLDRAKKCNIGIKQHVVMPPERNLEIAEEKNQSDYAKEIVREVKSEESSGGSVLRVIVGIIIFLIGMYLLITSFAGSPTIKYEGEIFIRGIK